MAKSVIKQRMVSIVTVMFMLPAILGVHVFKHYCNGCKLNDVEATVITTYHSHQHQCASCNSEANCECCATDPTHSASHCDGTGGCQHEYKVFDYKTIITSYDPKLQEAELELFASYHVAILLETITSQKHLSVDDAVPLLSNPNLLQKNCVFLL
ncbi:hypothetical protein DMA11_01760 [Marinilabiliaceae bacterium JC017]|nr:hypothetical protein DMA11_01760 [Marinilabiliaceae bacterium JC017]